MSFVAALLITMGKSFAEGAMSTIGCAAASIVVPIIMPRIVGAVKGFANKAPVEEDIDPDLC